MMSLVRAQLGEPQRFVELSTDLFYTAIFFGSLSIVGVNPKMNYFVSYMLAIKNIILENL